MSLDRFSSGLPDQQEEELKIVYCCASCGQPIYSGDEVCRFPDGTITCDDIDCIVNWAGAVKITAGEG